jgi:ryanodine receptor 2
MKKNNYAPQPVETSDVELSAELLALTERIAENVHDVWAVARIADGWTYGAVRDDARKQHPCLVPYEELSENEKEYDRNTAMETLKLIKKLGFEIKNKGGKS